MKKWYYDYLQKFIEFVGEPSEHIRKNIMPLITFIIYLGLGWLTAILPNNVLLKVGVDSVGLTNCIIGVFFIGGYIMLMDWLFLLNKILCGKEKAVSAENCWWLLKVLFLAIIPIVLAKKLLSYILREVRQEIVATYVPELFLALALTLVVFLVIEIPVIKESVFLVNTLFHISLKEEFIGLCMVATLIFTFFITCRALIHKSIKSYVSNMKKNELKRKSKINISGTMEREDIQIAIEAKYEELKEKANIELKYSQIYFYVIVNIILLSLHIEDNDTYGRIFANAFMGMTTLAALFREVGANIKHEQKSHTK